MGFVEIVIDALDLGIIILAFSFLESNSVSKSIDLILISGLLLSVFSKFVLEVIGVLPESVSLVTFDSNISLKCYTFLLSSADLVPDGSYLSLVLVVRSVLLVQKESKIFNFFSKRVDGHNILVVSVVVVVVLHQFFILNMSIFLLDSVKLISQSKVVFVSLLNLKDFCFQLRNQQVFLVTSKMHGIVVL